MNKIRKISDSKSKRLEPKILELLNNKIAMSVIGKKLKLSYMTIKKIAISNGISIHDCKSKRLEPKILELLKKQLTISAICKKLKMSHATVKKIARANGIDIDGRIESGKRKQKKERNELIHKLLLENKTYDDIAIEMNVTKQRVSQLAKLYNISRWEESRKNNKDTVEKIKADIDLCLPYNIIMSKYKLTNSHRKILRHWGLPTHIREQYTNKRNQQIIKEYKSGKKAREIIASTNTTINDPLNVKTTSQVYAICVKEGFYKYPNVGRRIDGVTFEKKSILRLIKKLREEKEFTYKQIANQLNEKKYKTISDKTFNEANVRFKYFDSIKEGL